MHFRLRLVVADGQTAFMPVCVCRWTHALQWRAPVWRNLRGCSSTFSSAPLCACVSAGVLQPFCSLQRVDLKWFTSADLAELPPSVQCVTVVLPGNSYLRRLQLDAAAAAQQAEAAVAAQQAAGAGAAAEGVQAAQPPAAAAAAGQGDGGVAVMPALLQLRLDEAVAAVLALGSINPIAQVRSTLSEKVGCPCCPAANLSTTPMCLACSLRVQLLNCVAAPEKLTNAVFSSLPCSLLPVG